VLAVRVGICPVNVNDQDPSVSSGNGVAHHNTAVPRSSWRLSDQSNLITDPVSEERSIASIKR
jgi:hypothetical protein